MEEFLAKKEAERLAKQNAANPYAITEEESAQADNNGILSGLYPNMARGLGSAQMRRILEVGTTHLVFFREIIFTKKFFVKLISRKKWKSHISNCTRVSVMI